MGTSSSQASTRRWQIVSSHQVEGHCHRLALLGCCLARMDQGPVVRYPLIPRHPAEVRCTVANPGLKRCQEASVFGTEADRRQWHYF